MASGFVLTYVVIAAIAFPFVWLVWWALDSLASRPARIHTQVHIPPAARPAYTTPHAVDASMPVRPSKVTVYSAEGAELSTCAGPDATGRCSRPLADGTVPCAGCVLALPRPLRGSLEWQIPSGYRVCLLGTYSVFRQNSVGS
jgi:hypothetical protein